VPLARAYKEHTMLLLLLGFVMITIGIALLALGEVPFLGGTRIPARRARLLGVVLVSFAPLTFGVRQLVFLLFGSDAVEGHIITWSVFGFCWFLAAVILFRVLFPKGGTRRASALVNTAPVKSAPVKKASAKSAAAKAAPAKSASAKTVPAKAAPANESPFPIVNIEFVPIPEATPAPPAGAKKPSAQPENPFDFS
jgi:hypothetical protein